MICSFPSIHKDELIYSMIARYQNQSGNVSIKSTTKDFFDDVKKSTFEMPSNLNKFAEEIEVFVKKDADYFIDNHTLFSYFTSFLNEKDTEMIRYFMKTNQGAKIYAKLGLLATDVKLVKKIRFCHKCIKNTLDESGEYYWNRIHQINEIYYCHIHQNPLMETSINIREGNRHQYYLDYNIFNDYLRNYDLYNENQTALNQQLKKLNLSVKSINSLKNHNFKLIKDIEFLMNNKIRNPLIFYKKQFKNQMMIKNYMTVNNTIKRKKLINDFISYFGKDYLKLLNCFPKTSDWNWILDVARINKRKTHIIRYLLVADFLGVNIKNLFIKKIKYEPFGGAKYECINVTCDKYEKKVINDYEFMYSYSSKKTVGIFKCKFCGMKYRKTCIEYGQEYNTKVLKYGVIWEKELKKLVNSKLSYREIARRLACDVGTIIKYEKEVIK